MPIPVAKKLLLIAWDAAEWSLLSPLLDRGELPNFARLIAQGTLARLSSLSPPLAGPLWTTVATGLRPEQHGVLNDASPARERHGSALWETAAKHGLRSIVIGWPATHPTTPLENSVVVSDAWPRAVAPRDQPWPLPDGAIFPERLREDLGELRVHPGEFARDDLRVFVPDIAEVDERAEPIVLVLAQHLAAATSVHCAATYLLENESWDFAAVHFAAPGAITRDFLDLAPPRLPQVPEKIFARYHRVIDETFKLHDQMLARLLELAGPDAAVLLCSASGWFTGAQRPALAPGEHAENVGRQRTAGWAVLRAPGAKTDDLLYGGSLLDLAPTAAWLLGLPVAANLAGREWTHAFEKPPPLTRLPAEKISPVPDAPAPTGDDEPARERRYALARYLLSAGRAAEAAPLLAALHLAWPHRAGPALHLIPALAALGRAAEARALLDELAARPEGGLMPREGRRAKFSPQFDFMRGVLDLAENKLPAALAHFERALAAGAQSPELHANLGRVYLGLRRNADAHAAFTRALETDADSAAAHYGLAIASYRLRDFPAAADHAMEAASRRTEPPEFHLLLGLALAHSGQRAQAIASLHHALARAPGLLVAHRALVALHRHKPAESFQADAHRRAVQEIFVQRRRRFIPLP